MSRFQMAVIAGLTLIVFAESRAATPLPPNNSISNSVSASSVGDVSATGGAAGAGGVGLGMGGLGGEGGTGLGTGGTAMNTGNSQSTTYDQVRQSPSVFINTPMPTGPCQASRGGFLSFIGGAGIAYSETLSECEVRETARIAHGIGQAEMAKAIICQAKYAKDTPQCK